MQSNHSHKEIIHGLASTEPQTHQKETANPEPECGPWEHPATGSGCDDAAAPSVNQAPRLVTRGESFPENPNSGERIELFATGYKGQAKIVFIPMAKPDGEPLAALTDFLNTTFSFNPTQENTLQLVRDFTTYLGVPFGTLTERKGGLHGYKTSFDIGKTGGMFAYGGQSGTALVSLPGSACALIGDWAACKHLFDDILNGRITRWDGAVDMFDGEPSIDEAVEWYKAGLFNAGGNKPTCHQNGNWIDPDGSGRTFNIGKRKNGKTLRIYEKGKQLGDSSSPWVRWELELHNRDRIIPWEVLLEPGKYLAASYRCMGWVNVIQERIRTTRNTANVGYQHLTFYLSQAYGRMLTVMEEVEGSPERVLELLKRPGVPSRLSMGDESVAPFIDPHDESPS